MKLSELARRRWLLLVAVLLVVVVVWALSRSESPPAETPASSETAGPGRNAARDSARVGATVAEVTLDSISERLAGIEVSTVRLAGNGALIVNGTITYDGNHVSVVASRAEGRILSVRTDLGQRVRQGGVLAIVESPEVAEVRGEWQQAQAAAEIAQRNYER
jgi:cobalt-zinc-cadmium efflux system membrane fusion protein